MAQDWRLTKAMQTRVRPSLRMWLLDLPICRVNDEQGEHREHVEQVMRDDE
jgi:hypothetical protein